MTTSQLDPLLGRLVDGRYEVRSRIARGGMATVYLAHDQRLERRVAIKVMHGHLSDDATFKNRFVQEARSAARLAHPNVVSVFDQGQDSDMAYLVMEYLPGITLRDLLKERGRLTAQQVVDIMHSVLSGLAAAHRAGILHRDLKPENVLLADDGRIKIGDFGLARAASANTASGQALLGTIAYLSPELVTRGIADTRSDLYAVGIMMYEMLVGEQPFRGEQPMQIAYQHANGSVPSPSTRNPAVPVELDELVLWATQRNPDDRPRDARQLLDRLFETHSVLMTAQPDGVPTQRTMVLPSGTPAVHATAETAILGSRRPQTEPVPGAAVALAEKSAGRRKRGWWIFGAIVLVAAIAGTVGWYFGAGPGSRVTIPASIAGLSPEDATTALKDLGLTVNPERGEANSPTIAVGAVAETTPEIGSPVAPGSEIQLLLSIGPKNIAVPAFAGMSEADATAAVQNAPFTLVEPTIKQFDDTVAAGTVIDALAADGSSLTGVTEYGELQDVTLVVSVGPLPDVQGKSVDEVRGILETVGLTEGAINEADFSDSVPKGAALRLQAVEGASQVRVGDPVDIITSRGQELVLIPDVVGETWDVAKPQLEEAGFSLDYNGVADLLPGTFVVSALTPGGGTEAPKGSSVKINFSS